ncbi:Pentatricopeptide repeat [Dillenia turbinata]|uniref:Pentatricopeptide repeat n=1 Tax=Dillenia turbinata TaxID=194707 RepID=A0AAN8UZ86_9MAGN
MNRCRDSYDYTNLLQQCEDIRKVKQIHAQIITGGFEQNPFAAAKLVGKYIEFFHSDMADARKVFDSLYQRDVFVWNMIIQGHANFGPLVESLNIYDQMRLSGVGANRYTFPFVLKACAALKGAKKGQVVHCHAVKCGFGLDLFVGNALVAFYAKCSKIEESRRVFDKILDKDLVSWNSMISGYAVNGRADEAIKLFHDMLNDETVYTPNAATFVSVLPACFQASAIQEGLWIHSYIMKTGMQVDASLGSGLVSMYGSCGRLNVARDIFDRILDKTVAVWNSIIRAYGMHGHADEALKLFSQMLETGLCPDSLIFLCILSACSHSGMVDRGWEIFKQMEAYGIQKNDKHYACMVDLLGRAGLIDEAVEFIKTMPVQAGKDVYGALLGACRIHNNIELAEKIAEKLFVLDPENAGRYMILANMYEDAGRWDDAARVRKTLRERNIKKPLGWSAIEVESALHTFGVEDESHPFSEQIFDMLEILDNVGRTELEFACR